MRRLNIASSRVFHQAEPIDRRCCRQLSRLAAWVRILGASVAKARLCIVTNPGRARGPDEARQNDRPDPMSMANPVMTGSDQPSGHAQRHQDPPGRPCRPAGRRAASRSVPTPRGAVRMPTGARIAVELLEQRRSSARPASSNPGDHHEHQAQREIAVGEQDRLKIGILAVMV